MFKEILQIVPKLSSGDLAAMEKSLQGRFSKVAKSFGRGLRDVLTGGGLIAAATSLLNKALSPLKEVQEAIDRTLEKGSDLTVNAKQFGSTPGELAKLHAFGQAKGIGSQELDVLITKFQTAVAQAVADPTKDTSVRQFTGEKDSVKAFFSFIQGLQKLGKTDQLRVQTEVFGEKQILKMSEFLNADFPALVKAFADIKTDRLTKDIKKLDDVGSLHQQLEAHTSLADLGNKAQRINKDQVIAMDQAEKTRLERENKNIENFKGLISIDEKMQVIQDNLEKLSTEILLKIPVLTDGLNLGIDLLRKSAEGWRMLFEILRPLANSRIARGIKSIFGGGGE